MLRPGPFRPTPNPGPVDHDRLRPGPLRRPQETDPTWRTRRDRLTPFLVIRTGSDDYGQERLRRVKLDTPTLRLVRVDTGQPSGFELHAGVGYRIEALVSNMGQGPCLMGMATARLLHGTRLMALWGKPDPTFFDVIDFECRPGRAARLRFRKVWVAPKPGKELDGRVSLIVQAVDMLGDNAAFVVDGGGDRHALRQDYHLT